MVHDLAEAVIRHGFFVQCHADAHDDAAENLASRGLRIDDAAGRSRADDLRDANYAEILVDPYLGKYSGVRVAGIFAHLQEFRGRLSGLDDFREIGGMHYFLDGEA